MKNILLKIFIVTTTLAVCLSFSGCKNETVSPETPDIKENYYRINEKNIYFLSNEEKQEWKEPLSKLLSNVWLPYGEHGEILGYEASIDPHAPVIPQSYECGLLDVTRDGIPDLLVHPFGYHGSSGTATYFVYNIYSGQKIGEIDGGRAQSWSYYYYTETDDFNLVGQYWLRCGWEQRDRYITTVFYDETTLTCYESAYLHTFHQISGEKPDILDEDPDDMFYTATWVESYPNTKYYVHNQEVYLDDYYAEYDWFVKNCIRIPETELILFRWDDVSDDEDDYITKGEKMATALISSSQQFIKKEHYE